jgi:hypothetical protein
MKTIFFSLILISSLSFGQTTYFNNTYILANYNLAGSLIENDSTLIVIGMQFTSNQIKMMFYKLNKFGDTLKVKQYEELNTYFYSLKILIINNNFIVSGAREENNNTNFFLASFNLDFELNWMKTYGGLYFDNGIDFQPTSDNGFILSGVTTSSETSPEDAYLIKTDSLGNVEWEQTYGGNNIELVYSVIETYDGGYVFSGSTKSYSIDQKFDFYTVKINAIGDVLWQKTYGDTLDENVCFVTQSKDSSIILCGASNIDLGDNKKGVILKLNKDNGEIIWQKEHLIGSYTNLYHAAIELEDKCLVVSGGVKHGDDTQLATIFKYDSLGNEIWHREYYTRTDIDQYFYDVIATKDGGLALCGSAYDSLNIQRAWVVKTDCFGFDSLHYYYKDSICNIEDCIRYAEDANFTVNTDSLEFLQNQALVVNNTSQDATLFWDFGDGFTIENETSVTHTYLQEGSYDVQLIFNKGMCSDTTIKTIFVGAGLGIDPLMSDFGYAQPSFSIFPNPNNGSFTVENFSGEKLDLLITDTHGKIVFLKNINSEKENIELELEKGIYFVTFGEQVVKMVVR